MATSSTGNPRHKRIPVLIANGFAVLPYFSPFPTSACLDCYRREFGPVERVPWKARSMWDVRSYARQIAGQAERLLQRAAVPRIALVGWSMGGVSSLYAMQRLGLADRTAALVAFGAPFSGVPKSWRLRLTLSYFRSMWQLARGSQLLQELLETPLPAGVPMHSIGGTRDLLCPPDTTILPGAKNHLTGHGHEAFINDRGLHGLIAHLLQRSLQ